MPPKLRDEFFSVLGNATHTNSQLSTEMHSYETRHHYIAPILPRSWASFGVFHHGKILFGLIPVSHGVVASNVVEVPI